MAGKYKIVCDQGATLRRTLTIQSQGATPEPWDLDGYSARMQVRTAVEADEVTLELTTANGRLVVGTGGQLEMLVSAADTAALDAASYVYDLEVESPAGEVVRLLEGAFVVRRNVTR